MANRYRGFTVSCNAIGAGRVLRKYLVLACKEMLTPLLTPANRNMVEAKCSCQIFICTRAVFRKSSVEDWIKFQLIEVVAPNQAKHLQAKRLMESLLPGSSVLQEYKNTARARIVAHEFVPDNKKLVFGLHRNGITHFQFGEVDDLDTPRKPKVDSDTKLRVLMPWQVTKRERTGVCLPSQTFPLERKIDVVRLMEMLLADTSKRDENKNLSNVNRSNFDRSEIYRGTLGRSFGRKDVHGFLDNPPGYANSGKYSLLSPPPAFGLV